MNRLLIMLVLVALLPACGVNPVTGERNFNFMSEDWERKVGAEMYAPMRQAQGGDFILDPQLLNYVQGVGQSLARHATRPLDYEFHILNDSTPNAWALPGGKIVVHRGLLTELRSEAELAAVLGHEIIHADAAHGAQGQSRGMATQLGSVAAIVALGTQVDSRQAQQIGMLGIQLGAQLVTSKYGRDAEREADEYGIRAMAAAGYDPQGAVQLQETFVELARRGGKNSNWLSGLFASHPPSQERVDNNRRLAATLPAGGQLGQDRYRRNMAYLEKIAPAYAAYDKGRKALAKRDINGARSLAREALKIEPREAAFHALLGDTRLAEKDYRKAERNYSDAIQRDDGFFYNYLRRGQVRERLHNQRGARQDFEASLRLLPTAEAHLGLGLLHQQSGNQDRALAHFKEAAKAEGSPSAAEAHKGMARIKPVAYLALATGLTSSGTASIAIRNQSPLSITGVRLRIEYINAEGRRSETHQPIRGTLAPGKAVSLAMKQGPFASNNDLAQRLRVTIVDARAL